MRILLVGEYSRLHNSLKEGLQAIGHEVTLVSTGDAFKKYPSDLLLKRHFDTGFSKKIKVALFHIFGLDISSLSLKNQFFKQQEKYKGFDVVQLINESPMGILPKHEKEIISFLKKNNQKLFLLSCGTDFTSVQFAFEKKFRYSILTPFFEGKASEKSYFPVLKYLKPEYRKLHEFVFESAHGIIASDLDYHIPLEGHPKYLGLIPNPVNIEKLRYQPLPSEEKIIFFHGINRANYFKKGNDYFEAALKKLQQEYPSKVAVITVENVPYSEYIEKFNAAHIVLDQVFAYDQGYNALEAMAKGKVVFTGAEREFLVRYNLEEDEVCINARPDVEYLFKKMQAFILYPEKLGAISKNARDFIAREHDYRTVAKKYLHTWEQA